MAFNKESFEHFWQHLDILFGRKVDKVAGKGLSSNDFTNEDKEKLASLKECVQSDWNVNNENDPAYVKNRTHHNIDHSIVWDGNADGLTPVEILGGMEYYKMSDYVPSTRQELIGQIYTVTQDGSSYPFTITRESFNEVAFLFDIYFIDFQIAIVTKDDALSEAGLKLAKGIYFTKPLRSNIFISSFSLPTEIKQLDEKFIPETIARKTDVNAPKDFIIFKDRSTGILYYSGMDNGNWVTWCDVDHIKIAPAIDNMNYIEGMKLSKEDFIVTAFYMDGSSKYITEYDLIVDEILTLDSTNAEAVFTFNGKSYSDNITFTVVELDSETKNMLIDFQYDINGNNTYTLTDWYQTYNGNPSTEVIIPDSPNIIL